MGSGTDNKKPAPENRAGWMVTRRASTYRKTSTKPAEPASFILLRSASVSQRGGDDLARGFRKPGDRLRRCKPERQAERPGEMGRVGKAASMAAVLTSSPEAICRAACCSPDHCLNLRKVWLVTALNRRSAPVLSICNRSASSNWVILDIGSDVRSSMTVASCRGKEARRRRAAGAIRPGPLRSGKWHRGPGPRCRHSSVPRARPGPGQARPSRYIALRPLPVQTTLCSIPGRMSTMSPVTCSLAADDRDGTPDARDHARDGIAVGRDPVHVDREYRCREGKAGGRHFSCIACTFVQRKGNQNP